MTDKNNETNNLLKNIDMQIENSKINPEKFLKPQEKQSKKTKKSKENKVGIYLLKNILGILSLGTTIAIFMITQNIDNDNSPLNYSIELNESVPKIQNDKLGGDNERDYFTFTPYMSYSLKRNGGGEVKELYLLKVSDEDNDEIKLTSSIIDNDFTNKPSVDNSKKSSSNNNRKFYVYDNSLIWNQKNNIAYIYDPELQMSRLSDNVSTYFLLLRGSNNTTEVITILQKLGDKEENYLDTTVSFNSLDIFDFKSWDQQAKKTNLADFEKVYKKTINDYKKVIDFAKENLL
ncbi:hypothetical protein [Enterococcus faecium]|uniref:hypothetical protein n=1 Tax=Enterococcus faecium TaxID=1352 RepID=UPI002EA897A9|nr:hypothetical protein [Enterococcus faecium]